MIDPVDPKSRFSDAIELLGGDFQLLKKMASVTAVDLPATIEAVERSIDGRSEVEAEKQLHRLKGMLSAFEPSGVAIELQKMMTQAASSDFVNLTKCYRDRRGAIMELVGEIQRLADS